MCVCVCVCVRDHLIPDPKQLLTYVTHATPTKKAGEREVQPCQQCTEQQVPIGWMTSVVTVETAPTFSFYCTLVMPNEAGVEYLAQSGIWDQSPGVSHALCVFPRRDTPVIRDGFGLTSDP